MMPTKTGSDYRRGYHKPDKLSVIKEEPDPEKYKKKCKKVKRLIKELVYENVSLCDQIAYLQEKTLQMIDERNYLFKKLYTYQPHSKSDIEYLPVKSNVPSFTDSSSSRKNIPKKRNESTSTVDVLKCVSKPSKKSIPLKKKKTVKTISLDPSGKPIFPILLGQFTVHSLGEICERSAYHTDDILYPIGYCSTRIYGNPKTPEKQCIYTCKIVDGGASPRFEIAADVDMDYPIVSSSIDHCHSLLLQRINSVVGTDVVNTKGKGADFFGLTHPTVHHLIQVSPGVSRCKKYIPTKFEVNPNYEFSIDDTDASLSFNALSRSIAFSKSHLEPILKQEPIHDYPGEDVSAFQNILLS